MTNQYPIVVLIKIISTLNYKDIVVRDWSKNKQPLTINKICHIIGINTSVFEKILDIWQSLGIAREVKGNGKERYLSISKKIITSIEKSNDIRKKLKSKCH